MKPLQADKKLSNDAQRRLTIKFQREIICKDLQKVIIPQKWYNGELI